MVTRTVFLAAKRDDDYVIDIFDFIGQDFFGEGVTSKSIARALSEAQGVRNVVVRINSPGGLVHEGVTIYNLLRDVEANVRVEVHGIAASMASIVALAGDEVHVAEGAMFMIHNPWGVSAGDSGSLRKTAAMLDKVKSNMLDIYARRSNLSREKLTQMMDDETWMTPLEAVKYGFADSVIDFQEDAAASIPKDRTFATLSKYGKVPPELLEQLTSQDGMRLVAAMKEQPQKKENAVMERTKIIMLLGLPADATDEQIEMSLASRGSMDLSQFVPRADFDALRTRMLASEEERRATEKADFERRVSAAIDAACVQGKITPASKQFHTNTCMNAAQKVVDGKIVFDIAQGNKQLSEFNDYVGMIPVIVDNSQMRNATDTRGPVGEDTMLSNAEVEVLRKMNLTREEMQATRAEMKSRPDVYDPTIYRFAIGN